MFERYTVHEAKSNVKRNIYVYRHIYYKQFDESSSNYGNIVENYIKSQILIQRLSGTNLLTVHGILTPLCARLAILGHIPQVNCIDLLHQSRIGFNTARKLGEDRITGEGNTLQRESQPKIAC